jgi:hypothetical protein
MMILKTSRSNLSSNDQLALDLPFAATKSLAARVGPTPTFTRGSGATYIGSDGLIHGVDTSTTSNTIGTGSKSFTLAATAGQDQLWRAGDVVEASNGSNFMTGTVTSYDAATQSLVCNITSIGGSGTFTSWRIGYRGPRFDHTSAGVCRGLLIEESRTNLILQSDNFASASWTKSGASISSNVETAPDDSVSADKLITDNGVTLGRAAQTFTLTGSHVYSVFAKASEWGWISIFPLGPTGGVWFDLVNGVVGTQGSGRVGSITSFGNGWYRCAVQFTGIGTSNTTARIISTNADGVQSTGDGTSGIFIWGAQMEEGSFATSYIPTVASSVVRSADVCSITGGDFSGFYNRLEGTLFAGCTPQSVAQSAVVVGVNTTTFLNSHFTYKSNSTASGAGLRWVSGSIAAPAVNIASSTDAATAFAKIAYAYKSGSFAMAYNNILAGTSSSTFTSINPTVMRIGSRDDGLAINGHISEVKYFKKRLPNAKLQALTV